MAPGPTYNHSMCDAQGSAYGLSRMMIFERAGMEIVNWSVTAIARQKPNQH